jgi:hypothetical protein
MNRLSNLKQEPSLEPGSMTGQSSPRRHSIIDDLQSDSTIPQAHFEYEKMLRQLEEESRMHIKCEQQMKLHIEVLNEKV